MGKEKKRSLRRRNRVSVRSREKGQAAMEFLMTYGWAILAAIIAIGVLSAYGVFSPDRYASSDQVVVGPPFYGNGASGENAEGSQGEISFEILNKGEDYIVTGVDAIGCGSISSNVVMAAGSLKVFTIPCDSNPLFAGFAVGKMVKGDMNIRYRKQDSALELNAQGSYTVRIRKGISPILNVLFGGQTPANGATLPPGNPLTLEFSTYSQTNLDRYAFVDLDNSLVGWWRMDDTDSVCSGTPDSDCTQWDLDGPNCQAHTLHSNQCTWDGINENCQGTLTCVAQSSSDACTFIFGCSWSGTSGSNVDDLSNNNYDGTIQGVVSRSSGNFGDSVLVSQSNYIEIGNIETEHPNLNIYGPITISAWVKISGSQENLIILTGFGNLASTPYYLSVDTQVSPPTLIFKRGDDLAPLEVWTAVQLPAFTENDWHHVAVTVDDGAIRNVHLYFDGAEIGSTTYSGTPTSYSQMRASIGGHYMEGSKYINGEVDELILFKRELSADEINAIYNAGSGYTNTFTLTPGGHTYRACIVDADGNLKCTSTRTVTAT